MPWVGALALVGTQAWTDLTQISVCQGKGQEPGPHGDLGRVTALFLKSCWPTVGVGLESVGGMWLPLELKMLSFTGWPSGGNHQEHLHFQSHSPPRPPSLTFPDQPRFQDMTGFQAS